MPDETRSTPTPAPRPVPRAAVSAIAPYVPGKSKADTLAHGVTRVFKLSSNETPLGPSPKARAAYAAAADRLDLYPDGSAAALREAIAARYGLDPARILCGAGSDELLNLLAAAYLSPGDEGLYSEHGFLIYKSAIMAAGGVVVTAPERDLTVDVDAMLARVTERTRLVFLANPNNPTGTYIPADEVRRLHAGLRPDILFVIDAAYAEYVRRNDYTSGLEIVLEHDNAVMTRTFSKIHGLAGLRLGWMVAPPHVVDAVNRIRSPFNINSAAMAAGIAAIRDTGHVEASIEHNDRWLAWLAEEIGALGLAVTPSAGNFLCVHFPAGTAAAADAFLSSRGLILRRIDGYGLPDALRLTVGGEEANRAVVAALREFTAGARA